MLELATHIVETKASRFDPKKFEDQYEDALKELLKKKQHGEKLNLLGSARQQRSPISWMHCAVAWTPSAAQNGESPRVVQATIEHPRSLVGLARARRRPVDGTKSFG
jgi:non-homologous end joining protein Ku